jgi:S1-C subfamily serine protease
MDHSWPPPPPPRRSFGIVAVLGAALASAIVASVATVAVVGTGTQPGDPRPTSGFQAAATLGPVPSTPALGVGAASPASSLAASPGALSGGGVAVSSAPSPSASRAADPNAVIVAVAAHVSPAVVTITTDVSGGGSFSNPFSLPATGVGSGFVFDATGWILTNDHVIEGASRITVTLKGGRQLPGRVVATDENADLAVVKVNATDLPSVAIGSSQSLQVGQLLIAIGSPLGTYSDSVTSGILSATGRTVTVADGQTRQRRRMTNMLQTDAAINPGNSGGPLLDGRGDVIGINSAVDQSVEGVGFAIPIDAARTIMDQAKKAG